MFDQKNSQSISGSGIQALEAPATVTSTEHLPAKICPKPEKMAAASKAFGMRIPAHYLALIEQPDDALAKQVIPDPRELEDPRSESDPLAEEAQSPTPLIIHRYPHRVIFLITNQCAVHCRFCMRKRRVGTTAPVGAQAIKAGLTYIEQHPEISEVILSGGDPFMLSDASLQTVLNSLRPIPHLRMLRIHSRIPCVWPQRITDELAKCLSSFQPLYINIHFNHPREITPEVISACNRLADAGMPLGSQTVLLKGVNDNADTLIALFEKLLAIRVRPYYLHLLDRVPGTAHFQLPIDKSLSLVQQLRGRLSGMGMPHLMADLPGGGGKIELLPESKLVEKNDHLALENFQGNIFYWPLK